MCGGTSIPETPAPTPAPPAPKKDSASAPDPNALSEARTYVEEQTKRQNRKNLQISLGNQSVGGSGLAV